MPIVIVQNWEESERGWGVRPDGFTVHISQKQRDEYVDWYYKKFNNLPNAPDDYTRVSGDPFPVDVPIAVYNKVAERSLKKIKDQIANAAQGVGSSFGRKDAMKKEDIR